jgi:hypothetical protein
MITHLSKVFWLNKIMIFSYFFQFYQNLNKISNAKTRYFLSIIQHYQNTKKDGCIISEPKVRMWFTCDHLFHKAAGHDNTDVMI